MQIEHINISMPGADGEPAMTARAATEVARETADLESLAQSLVQAVRRRNKISWSAQARSLRHQQFGREIKGIVKRLASGAVAGVAEKNGRQQLRARVYMDALAMVTAVTTDIDRLQERARLLRRWSLGVLGIVVVVGGGALAVSVMVGF